jgi:sugar phosphate permease
VAIAGGTALMSLGGFVFATWGSLPVAFVGRTVVGLGGSFLFIAILRFCANWYRPDEFARMSGLTLAVAGVGGVLATTPLAVAVERLGWRAALLALAAVGSLVAVLVTLAVRDTPADAGLEPIEVVPTPGTPDLDTVVANARTVLAERATWLAGVAMFGATGVNITVFGLWGVPYVVQTYGTTVTRASTFTLLGSAGLLVGPPLIGAVSDRLGRRTDLVALGMAISTATFGFLAVVGRPALSVVGGAFFLVGALAGANALVYAVVKERHDATASGVATGTVNTLAFSGAAVLPPVMGALLEGYATERTIGGATVYSVTGYRVAFGLATAVLFVAAGCALALHYTDGRSPST